MTTNDSTKSTCVLGLWLLESVTDNIIPIHEPADGFFATLSHFRLVIGLTQASLS